MSFQYKIYGLQISSSRRISTLTETVVFPADLTVDFIKNGIEPYHDLNWQSVSTPGLQSRETISVFTAQTQEGVFYKIIYQLRNGRMTVLVNPRKDHVWICSDTISDIDIESLFVGTVIGAVLRLRDTLSLHASVVVVNRKAVAFLGWKRSGKSTIAAAFSRLGYGVLADDIAVIKEEAGVFYVQPGYPRLRLRPQTLEVMHHGEVSDLQAVNSRMATRYSDITGMFCADPLPLGALFILSPGTIDMNGPSVSRLTLSESLVQLGKNTFANYVISAENRKREFDLLARLATEIPVNRLQIIYNITRLDEQCSVVLNHINHLSESLY